MDKDHEALKQDIRNLRDDFHKFFQVASTLLPEIAETRTLQRLVQEREESRKRNSFY
jgi:hypothetical protein